MKSKDFMKRFMEFEEENNLFELEDEDGILYWDLIRHKAFYKIHHILSGFEFDKEYQKKQKHHSLLKLGKIYYDKLLKVLNNEFYYLYQRKNKKNKYVFYTVSRHKNENNEFFDALSNDILNLLDENEVFRIEGFNSEINKSYYMALFGLVKKLKSVQNKNYKLTSLLNEEFDVSVNWDSLISNTINNYQLRYKIYKKMLSNIKPNAVFLIRDGSTKSLIAAANDLSIFTLELQHGQINFAHPAYSYSKKISYNSLKTFPKYFLTLSDFWSTDINYPVNQKITLGNSYYYCNSTANDNKKNVTFIYSKWHTEHLLSLTKEFAVRYNNKIFVKLHPNQKSEINFIKKELKKFKNVKVIFDEKSMDYLLEVSHSMITIASTVVYQALQSGTKIFLYKKQNYLEHKDVFDNKNVYLFNSIDKLINNINNEYHKDSDNIYFEKFKEDNFKELLKEIKSDHK